MSESSTGSVEPPVRKDGSLKCRKGDKRLANGVLLTAAEKKRDYYTNTQYLPVAEVLAVDSVPLTAAEGRRTLLTDLWPCWRKCAMAMNYAMQMWYNADTEPLVPATSRDGKSLFNLPKMPAEPTPGGQSLYLATRVRVPDLLSSSIAQIVHESRGLYKSDRFGVRVLINRQTRIFKSPQPFPVPASTYEISEDADGRMLMRFKLQNETGLHNWSVRLKGGSEFRRQINAIREVLVGGGWFGAAKICWGKDKDIMVAVSVSRRKRQRPEQNNGAMLVKTGPDRLWTVWVDEKAQSWKLHEDHILRLLTAQRIASHQEELQRLSDDSKCERRTPKADRSRINQRRGGVVERYQNRVEDALQKASMLLARYAVRRRVASVTYDDRDHSYWIEGPYYRLREMVQQKLAVFNIDMTVVEALEPPPTGQSPASPTEAGERDSGAATL